MVRYRLGQSSLRAPFAGFVVEGDQKERIGAPVRAGDVLFKIARSDVLFVEADVNERDVHEIKAASRGEIAFASQPKFKFPIQVERVRVAAQPKEGENVFVTRCTVQSLPESWWRPGMSGVCKIEAGRRTLLWILSHRTLDYLRLLLWW
jgi:multidrug efflux pump subunit AcrA (membrane-fusion protein)